MGWCLYFWFSLILFFGYWLGANRFDEHRDRNFDPSDVEAFRGDWRFLIDRRSPTDWPFLKRNFLQSKTARQAAKARAALGEAHVETAEHAAEVERLEKQRIPWFFLFEAAMCLVFWASLALNISVRDSKNASLLKAGLDSIADGMLDLRLTDTSCQDYRWQFWRWSAYQWTHVGVVHVLTNISILFMFAVPLEGLHGSRFLALTFNFGVLCGACCYFVADAHTAVVGCSGGIYILLGMHVADLWVKWQEKPFRIATAVLIGVLVAMDVLSYVLFVSAEYRSYSPHIGGAIAGLIGGVLLSRNKDMTLCEKILTGVLAFIGLALMIFSFVWLFMNRAPLNIWEAMQGKGGYCWIRQVFDPRINPNAWQCVRCGTQECIACWSRQQYLQPVNIAACNQLGYVNTVPTC